MIILVIWKLVNLMNFRLMYVAGCEMTNFFGLVSVLCYLPYVNGVDVTRVFVEVFGFFGKRDIFIFKKKFAFYDLLEHSIVTYRQSTTLAEIIFLNIVYCNP